VRLNILSAKLLKKRFIAAQHIAKVYQKRRARASARSNGIANFWHALCVQAQKDFMSHFATTTLGIQWRRACNCIAAFYWHFAKYHSGCVRSRKIFKASIFSASAGGAFLKHYFERLFAYLCCRSACGWAGSSPWSSSRAPFFQRGYSTCPAGSTTHCSPLSTAPSTESLGALEPVGSSSPFPPATEVRQRALCET
jgi:hypothetical protein